MADKMRPISFEELLKRIFSEYSSSKSIFGVNENQFYSGKNKNSVKVFSQNCSMPLGPAAGPHTQLAQNIITSYLVGARFIELKTVQIMDELEIAKPCIDARDEGYNVEWSSEYKLKKSRDEYYKAWIVCHLLEALFNDGKLSTPSFIFNMSVGYNLEGIKKPPMQEFIDLMKDASSDKNFVKYLKFLDEWIAKTKFDSNFKWAKAFDNIKAEGNFASKISSKICTQLTLSTMHGCPPKEIELIASYMLTEKKLDTFVKLNPTLLGYDEVRKTLDKLGYNYLTLSRDNFDHDLQWKDAVPMLKRLFELAKKENKCFGVKLTNTLGSVNDQGVLYGNEMYMSGRALYPLATALASKISKEFDGNIPISYSAGANAHTVKGLFAAGIRPITLATDMLHPGGYTKLVQLCDILNECDKATWSMAKVDVKAVAKLAKDALKEKVILKEFRGKTPAKIKDEELPLTDCFASPCSWTCPIHQDIPAYLDAIKEGKYAEALSIIYETNALPSITGTICPATCRRSCSRQDWEGCIEIRNMKLFATQKGKKEFLSNYFAKPEILFEEKCAVVGAGPAGLSTALFLSQYGFEVEVFERESVAGGVVRNVIPEFRISEKAIKEDVSFIEKNGVKFHYNVPFDEVKIDSLKSKGFGAIFYCIGAEKESTFNIDGDQYAVWNALDFLKAFRKGEEVNILKNVVVVGGGNTAMDTARAAKKVKGVEKVTLVYRRTQNEMPADREEVELAKKDGIDFKFLVNPVHIGAGSVRVEKMKLGEPDASGRRSPVPTGEYEEILGDRLLPAIGEAPSSEALSGLGLVLDERGRAVFDKDTMETPIEKVYVVGDCATGASVVVKCIASATKATDGYVCKYYYNDDECDNDEEECHCGCGENDTCDCKKGEKTDGECSCSCSPERKAFLADLANRRAKIMPKVTVKDAKTASAEAERCLYCEFRCQKCVDVCPNRANFAICTNGNKWFDENTVDSCQIIHIDGYCNECGNCASFCNFYARPYIDKFTVFSLEEDFEKSMNVGVLCLGKNKYKVRCEDRETIAEYNSKTGEGKDKIDEVIIAFIDVIEKKYSYLFGKLEK